MKFFSGFALKNEQNFFTPFIKGGEFEVVGFSYGAIKALKYAQSELQNFRRIDRFVLLSPAFFQTKEESFKRLQLRAFQKNKERYLKNFLKSCFAPYEMKSVEQNSHDGLEELEELLWYEWSKADLLELQSRGVVVEVYLGGLDSIIDAKGAFEFFKDVADVTFLKKANHFLQIA